MTVIKIKNSNVAGKLPGASDIVTAELALNLADRKLYSKDANGNIFEIAGGDGAQVPGGPTPPPSGNEIGDLFFDTTSNTLLYWDGTQWVPIAGDEALALDDLTDVTLTNPQTDELLVYNGAEWVNADPGYVTEAEVNNILEGLNPDGTPNPGAEGYLKPGDDVSELENDAGYLTEAEVNNIIEGNKPDGTPNPNPVAPDLQKVTDAGNNTTNNITLATDKIVLNADGSATFAKQITATEGYALAQLPVLP